MTLKPLGDSAWLVESPGNVRGLADALARNQPPGVLDVVPSFDTLAVHFSGTDGSEIREWIEAAEISDGIAGGTEHVIPVCYGGEFGPDIAEVAEVTGLSADEVIALHSGAEYTVAAVGFSPGFPYLSGLPERLRIPRRRTPRLKVPAGSVAVAGGQAGIYPSASPGGWHVLGRTGVCLFDPFATPPAMLQPGDRVKFLPVETWEPVKIRTTSPAVVPAGSSWIEVIDPGALTTVQDLGRPGHESSGVSPGGTVDRHALRMANLLVGNPEGAAVLELCLRGPVLRFHGAATIALAGASGKSQQVADGETVDFSQLSTGVRACLAIAGGIRVESVMGSASTVLRGGFGGVDGRTLLAGDRLAVGNPGHVPRCGDWHVGTADGSRNSSIELRFVRGVQEDWFSPEALRRFRESIYQLTPGSDRMGARLAGEALELAEPREMISQPVACGSVQVPPDGQPIVLLADRQTIGGYPQIGHVVTADLPKLARAWPGAALGFREVTRQEARDLLRRDEEYFRWLRTGLNLL